MRSSYYTRHYRNAIIDFTAIDTVYKRSLKTISIKINPLIAGDEGFKLLALSNGKDVCEIIRTILAQLDDDQEHFILLVLNLSGEVVGFKVLASGAMDHVAVNPKIVFRNALLLGASQFIVAHNHPSGNVNPSSHDYSMTNRLIQLGSMMALPLVDHIIVAGQSCVSLRTMHPEWFGE